MSLGPKKCSKCEKTVYPVEEIIYLDKSWHKGCLKCTVCNTTLNIKSAKGYEKQPYCNVHYPQLKSTAIADNPELQRIRQLTDVQSNAKYRKDFNEDRDALMKPYTPRICSVCNEKKEWCAFKNVNISGCQHEIRFVCNECLLQHVCIAIQQTFRDDIFCLEENCGVKFDYQSVKNILSLANDKQLLERYDRGLEQMNGFIHCSNPACGVEQLNEGGQSNPIVICYRCHQKTCFIHRIQWHEGMTCEEYDEQVGPDDEPSRQWIVTHTKQCPKCPWQIEKNDGCDHMTCIKCKHEFCWSCLADYQLIKTEGHRRHRDTCQHYRRVA